MSLAPVTKLLFLLLQGTEASQAALGTFPHLRVAQGSGWRTLT